MHPAFASFVLSAIAFIVSAGCGSPRCDAVAGQSVQLLELRMWGARPLPPTFMVYISSDLNAAIGVDQDTKVSFPINVVNGKLPLGLEDRVVFDILDTRSPDDPSLSYRVECTRSKELLRGTVEVNGRFFAIDGQISDQAAP